MRNNREYHPRCKSQHDEDRLKAIGAAMRLVDERVGDAAATLGDVIVDATDEGDDEKYTNDERDGANGDKHLKGETRGSDRQHGEIRSKESRQPSLAAAGGQNGCREGVGERGDLMGAALATAASAPREKDDADDIALVPPSCLPDFRSHAIRRGSERVV
jgi:hypothetical protein